MRRFKKETDRTISTVVFTDDGNRVSDSYTKSNKNNRPFIKRTFNIEDDIKQLIRRGFTEEKV